MLIQILEMTTNVLIGAVLFNLITLYSVWSGANFIRTSFSKNGIMVTTIVLSLFLGYNVLLLTVIKSGGC